MTGAMSETLSFPWPATAVEAFLGRHLGGRAEPPGEDETWESLLR
jgi:hypothetical protein